MLEGGTAVTNARVQITALKPNGINKSIATGYTDSNGDACKSFVSGTGSRSIGTHKHSIVSTSGTLIEKDAMTLVVYK